MTTATAASAEEDRLDESRTTTGASAMDNE